MNGGREVTWDRAYYEAWVALVLMVGLYVWGLIAGWVGWPWA